MIELEKLWKFGQLPIMFKCRELFTQIAVKVAMRKWNSYRISNELNRKVAKPQVINLLIMLKILLTLTWIDFEDFLIPIHRSRRGT